VRGWGGGEHSFKVLYKFYGKDDKKFVQNINFIFNFTIVFFWERWGGSSTNHRASGKTM